MNPFQEGWGNKTDSEWLQALIESCSTQEVNGVNFPAFPDPELQRFIQGASGEVAIRGAFKFYQEARTAAHAAGKSFRPDRTLLDFGSGWGRTIRPFMRDFALGNIIGMEPETKWCNEARKLNPYLTFVNSDYAPPTIFKDSSFDYIVSYSVFTHLPEGAFKDWLDEFRRILKPGGVVIFTFLSDRLVREIRSASEAEQKMHFWHKILLDHLGNLNDAAAKIDDGDVIFLRTQSSETYGDTFMSAKAIQRIIRDKFEVCHLNQADLAQDVCALRRT